MNFVTYLRVSTERRARMASGLEMQSAAAADIPETDRFMLHVMAAVRSGPI